MGAANRFSKGRLISFALLLLLPLSAVLLGVIVYSKGMFINPSFVIMFMILPGLFILLLAPVLFSSKLHGFAKLLICILLIVLFVRLLFACFIYGFFEKLYKFEGDELIAEYTGIEEEFSLLPSLSEIGEPLKIEAYYYFQQYLLYFGGDSYYLICEYDDAGYEEQIKLLNERYVFQDGLMSAHGYSCEPYAVIDGYTFRALSVGGEYESDILYPKVLVFVATNDVTREIVYLSFNDDDIDYITSLREFLLYDCGWEHIR